MKFLSVFLKTLREMSRERWMLGLTLAFAPFFVLLYWLITAGGSTTYTILVINQDRGGAGQEIFSALSGITYADGQPILKPMAVSGLAEAEVTLKNRGAVAFILIPKDFSQILQNLKAGDRSVTTQITFGGDVSNPYYMVGVNLALTAVDGYIQKVTGQQPLMGYLEKPLGSSAARTEFESYIPGTLVFAVILLIFLASMTVAREIETGTLRRLQLTQLSALELLGGISAALTVVGTASFGLAFAVAIVVGFRCPATAWLATVLIGAISTLSVIGLGMVVASLTRTVSQAFIVANFPLGLMMFFSGVVYPLPKVVLFVIGGHEVGLYDLLPPTHAVSALNKILNIGSDLLSASFELTALTFLSLLYFGLGVWLFQRLHLRAENGG